MATTEVDLMETAHPAQLRQAYRDLDGVDWTLDPHDDRTVYDALKPDPRPQDLEGPAEPAGHRTTTVTTINRNGRST